MELTMKTIMRFEYTAHDVHKTLPWISGTTVFNRVKAGLIPVQSGGHGKTYKFSRAGLIHCAVVDELLSLGAWKSGVSGTSTQIDFFPAPTLQATFDEQTARLKADNAADGEAEEKGTLSAELKLDQMKALLFYELHDYNCQVHIDIKHSIKAGKTTRQKRATRTFYISFRPDPVTFPDADVHAPLTHGLDTLGSFACFSSAMINVFRIELSVTSELEP